MTAKILQCAHLTNETRLIQANLTTFRITTGAAVSAPERIVTISQWRVGGDRDSLRPFRQLHPISGGHDLSTLRLLGAVSAPVAGKIFWHGKVKKIWAPLSETVPYDFQRRLPSKEM